jgi:hypothetical protein
MFFLNVEYVFGDGGGVEGFGKRCLPVRSLELCRLASDSDFILRLGKLKSKTIGAAGPIIPYILGPPKNVKILCKSTVRFYEYTLNEILLVLRITL